jgi:hypothetical protein
MKYVLAEGFRRMLRTPGLVFLVYATNLLFAALLALPLAGALESELASNPGATLESGVLWADWAQKQGGWMREFSPDILGSGGFFASLERLLGGAFPSGLFTSFSAFASGKVDGVLLGLGLAYLLVQSFFAGGLLGTYRAARGTWSPNGFFHGSAFYFGRMLRTSLVGLLFAALAFVLHAPVARLLTRISLPTTSETAALLLGFLAHALLLLLLLFVSTVTSYARVIVVAEERRSAVLAYLSAVAFACGRNFPAAFGHTLVMATLVALLALGWARGDALAEPIFPAVVVLGQLVVAARIGLKLATLAGRYALFTRASGTGPSGGGSSDRI